MSIGPRDEDYEESEDEGMMTPGSSFSPSANEGRRGSQVVGSGSGSGSGNGNTHGAPEPRRSSACHSLPEEAMSALTSPIVHMHLNQSNHDLGRKPPPMVRDELADLHRQAYVDNPRTGFPTPRPDPSEVDDYAPNYVVDHHHSLPVSPRYSSGPRNDGYWTPTTSSDFNRRSLTHPDSFNAAFGNWAQPLNFDFDGQAFDNFRPTTSTAAAAAIPRDTATALPTSSSIPRCGGGGAMSFMSGHQPSTATPTLGSGFMGSAPATPASHHRGSFEMASSTGPGRTGSVGHVTHAPHQQQQQDGYMELLYDGEL